MRTYIIGKWATIFGAALLGMWFRIPNTIHTLVYVMGIDIVSGLLCAGVTKTLNSSIMLKGIWKKCSVFPILALLHVTEQPLSIPFELESAAAIVFIVYEAMSILENCARAGVPIPVFIVSALAKAKIKTATPEDIQREFTNTSQTMIAKSTALIPATETSPAIEVSKTATVTEEKRVVPKPEDGSGGK